MASSNKYNDTIPDRAFRLCLLRLTDIELGIAFDVTEKTINEWKKAYPEFALALKKGKYDADGEVAHSLYQRALGYDYEKVEVTKGKCTARKCHNEYITTKTTTMHVLPSEVAAIFFLKNRTRKNEEAWRDVHRQEHTGAEGGPIKVVEEIDFDDLTDEELDIVQSAGFKQLKVKGKNGSSRNRLN